jgi:hypothetical protein
MLFPVSSWTCLPMYDLTSMVSVNFDFFFVLLCCLFRTDLTHKFLSLIEQSFKFLFKNQDAVENHFLFPKALNGLSDI